MNWQISLTGKEDTARDPKRLERLQMKDDINVINASFEQMQSLKDRMKVFFYESEEFLQGYN